MEFDVVSCPISRPLDQVDDVLFWHVIEIWWRKPHCVNKRLCGADSVDFDGRLSRQEEEILKAMDGSSDCVTIRRMLPKDTKHFAPLDEVLCKAQQQCTAAFFPRPVGRTDPTVVPTNASNNSDGLRMNGQLQYAHVHFPYAISLRKDDEQAYLELKVEKGYSGDKGRKWLVDSLMKTLVRWMNNCAPEKPLTQSLRLVDLKEYNECYNRLKAKYGKRLVEIWTERTDPKKFVYEDIAIAAYLLILWEQERQADTSKGLQQFVDLGCGNGLLVYLLSNEGHSGYGIDVRKRQIWKSYGPNVTLIERAFEPSDKHLFPDADWLIGNHSDELTPWIPVIAAKSSQSCNFLTIPCCSWDFHGKYQRKDNGMSTYRSYIRYLLDVTAKCGFNAEEDILKIPSTKRVCIVGQRNRNITQEIVEENIAKLLSRCGSVPIDRTTDTYWIDGFSQRETKEKIQNCTSLPSNAIQAVVKRIAAVLLEKEKRYIETEDGKQWNCGGSKSIPECAKTLNSEELQLLKSQCGGLQTLMRNHRHIFKMDKENVTLRTPTVGDQKGDKKRICWFYLNHPDGCPLADHLCRNAHVLREI